MLLVLTTIDRDDEMERAACPLAQSPSSPYARLAVAVATLVPATLTALAALAPAAAFAGQAPSQPTFTKGCRADPSAQLPELPIAPIPSLPCP